MKHLTSDMQRYGYQGLYSEKDQESGFNSFELRPAKHTVNFEKKVLKLELNVENAVKIRLFELRVWSNR